MSRPPGAENAAVIDASVQAHAGGTVERRFSASQLPRLREAGIAEPVDIGLSVRFSVYEGRVSASGALNGNVTMMCQRCMRPVTIDLAEELRLLVVDDEADAVAEAGGFEPVVADPARLDLSWLAEEQALLGVPLVAKHADDQCASAGVREEPEEAPIVQRPFANLRKLLRQQ